MQLHFNSMQIIILPLAFTYSFIDIDTCFGEKQNHWTCGYIPRVELVNDALKANDSE